MDGPLGPRERGMLAPRTRHRQGHRALPVIAQGLDWMRGATELVRSITGSTYGVGVFSVLVSAGGEACTSIRRLRHRGPDVGGLEVNQNRHQ
jgi:hypothetical protein